MKREVNSGLNLSRLTSLKQYHKLAKEQEKGEREALLYVNNNNLWHALDHGAKRLGVPRQSIIKLWIAERLEKAS